MSKPRLKLVAIIDTLSHAKTIKSTLISELSGKDIFESHALNHAIQEDGSVLVHAEARFNSSIDRDQIKNWIISQITEHPSVKTWVQKYELSWHLCSHGDPVVTDCRESQFSMLSKGYE